MRVPATTTATDEVFAVSHGQQRLWLICQLDEAASRAHHLRMAVWLHGPLDVAALQRAVTSVVERHEVLRTTFGLLDETQAEIADRLVQIVRPDPAVTVRDLDLAGLGDEQVEERLAEVAAEEFDLETGPLLRVAVGEVGPDRWALVLVLHHIVGDGWSLGVLGRELSAAYGQARGEEADLPELDIQYADFAEWQRERVAESAESELGHWRSRLEGLPTLDLPLDRRRPVRLSYRGGRIEVEVDAALQRAAATLAAECGVTPYMVHLAAWQLALSYVAGQHDFAVSTPVAGRERPEVEPLIGFFVNSLVLRARTDPGSSFAQHLARTRDEVLDAMSHQGLPFDLLVSELGAGGDLSRPPLAQVGFSYQNFPDPSLALDGVVPTPIRIPSTSSALELALVLVPRATGASGWVEYSADLFDAGTARSVVETWQRVLRTCVGDPQRAVADLELVAEESQARSAAPTNPDLGTSLLPDRFAAAAAARPDGLAVTTPDGDRVTYAELERWSAAIADALRRRGVTRGDVVGIHLPRDPSTLAAVWGVWRCGAAYLPLDPGFPADRLELMVSDSGTEVVIDEAFVAETARTGSSSAPSTEVGPADAAYVIYTSGSTGRPKGVVVPHGAIASWIGHAAEELRLDHDTVWAAITTFSFDIATLELFAPLTVGGQVVLVPRCDSVDPELLLERLADVTATHCQATPSQWREILDSRRPIPAHLVAVSGGEAIDQATADRLTELAGSVWNYYGPTETTVYSARTPLRPGEPVSIGRAAPGESVSVRGPALELLPRGAVGELCIGGAGVARGYHGRPSLTAQRFVADPAQPGSRMYRTGDLGRVGPDGTVHCLGRTDNQVKLHGHRIELEEIEDAAAHHSDVQSCVVAVAGEGPGAHLVGYVVTAPRRPMPEGRELSGFLGGRLPPYMVPEVWMELDELPRTQNMKIDRRSLPDPVAAGSSAAPTEPADDTESAVLEVWRGLLQRSDVGVEDNFFAIGGNSMLAARMVAQLRERLGVRLAIAQVFEAGTVRQVAATLRAVATPGPPPTQDTFVAEVDELWDEEAGGGQPDDRHTDPTRVQHEESVR